MLKYEDIIKLLMQLGTVFVIEKLNSPEGCDIWICQNVVYPHTMGHNTVEFISAKGIDVTDFVASQIGLNLEKKHVFNKLNEFIGQSEFLNIKFNKNLKWISYN